MTSSPHHRSAAMQGQNEAKGPGHTPGTRVEFEMTQADLDELLAAMRPVPYMVIGGVPPRSRQENANAAWCSLGDRMGFDGMTVKPSGRGPRFFNAIAKAIGK